MDHEKTSQIAECFSLARERHLRVHQIAELELPRGQWLVYLVGEENSPLRHPKENHRAFAQGPDLFTAFQAAFAAIEAEQARIKRWWSGGNLEYYSGPAQRAAATPPEGLAKITLASLGLLK